MKEALSLNWAEALYNLWHLAIAFILALPIAYNREKETKYLGLRTYPLVALGACAFILTGISVVEGDDAIARIIYGVITGMGFIGGGAIIKDKSKVLGTANAASLWCTGALGAAVALNRFEIALLLSISIFFIFTLKPKVTNNEK